LNRPPRAVQDVDAFIFDLDGTLVDSSLDIANSANLLRQELGRAALPVELVVTFVGDGVGSLMQRLLGHDGPEPRPAELALARDRFRELYGPRCLEHTRPYPGVVEGVEAMSDRPLFIATNKPKAFTDLILEGLQLRRFFTRVVSGDEVPAQKPAPGHLQACLEGFHLAPSRIVMVGDHANDIRAAHALGARAAGVRYGMSELGTAEAEAEWVFDRFEDFVTRFANR